MKCIAFKQSPGMNQPEDIEMKTIIAKPVTIENFARYGEIQNLLNPSTLGFGAGSDSASHA